MSQRQLLWQFVREDAVGRSLALGAVLVAWFALTWVSIGIAALLPILGAALWWRYRTSGWEPRDDSDDLF